MRRLVGVLESTTQRIDERIRSIGSHIDPRTAPDAWLDYLGRWLDLPWDDELPNEVKRRVLQDAGALLDERGTRNGIRRLLRALLGPGAAVRIQDLTVDHAVAVLGGNGHAGPALPALLAGVPLRTPTLGGKAVIGRACLARPGDLSLKDSFDTIVPTLRVGITAPREIRQAIEPLLEAILAQYVPAGVRVRIRWNGASRIPDLTDTNPLVLDAEGPGRLGGDSTLGRTVLEGRRGRLDDAGLGVGLTVQ
jgi:phage tail-like protein